jgi:hypothetical protein
MKKPLYLLLTAIVLLGACSSAKPGTPRPANPDLITRDEIASAGVSNAYDLIQKLRPIWLTKRGEGSFFQPSDVVIYLDGTRLGGPDSLKDLNSTDIESLRFLDARQATVRFGSGHVHGAILVKTRG